MAGERTERRAQVVMGRFARGKGSVKSPKVMFFSYFAKVTFIQLTWLGPLGS